MHNCNTCGADLSRCDTCGDEVDTLTARLAEVTAERDVYKEGDANFWAVLDRAEKAEAKLAEVAIERNNWRDAAEHWKDERKLRERAYDLKGQEEQLLRRAEAAEAMLPAAYRAGVEAVVVHVSECVYYDSAGTGFNEDAFDTAIRALPTPTIEKLKEMLKDTTND